MRLEHFRVAKTEFVTFAVTAVLIFAGCNRSSSSTLTEAGRTAALQLFSGRSAFKNSGITEIRLKRLDGAQTIFQRQGELESLHEFISNQQVEATEAPSLNWDKWGSLTIIIGVEAIDCKVEATGGGKFVRISVPKYRGVGSTLFFIRDAGRYFGNQ
jgi:hypothetical protein